jgi:hypothetical protein
VVYMPRWSSTVRSDEAKDQRSVSSGTAGPYRKYWTPRSISSATALPLRSPLARASMSPSPQAIPRPVTMQNEQQHYRSFAERVADPSPARPGNLLDPVPYHRQRNATAPVPGLIRSPSSMAMHSASKAAVASTIPRPPSALSRAPRASLPPRMSSLKARVDPAKSQHVREPSLPHSDLEDQENRTSFSNDYNDEHDESLDQITDPGSSPLSRKTITRPGSQMASRGGKRMSMLPVPVGGRTSSLGYRDRVGS